MQAFKKIYALVLGLGVLSSGCAVQAMDEGELGELVGELQQALISDVTVEKVRACKHKVGCGSYVTNGQYHFWDDNNVAKDKQERTYLARFSEPAVANTEYVAMLFAGQQFGNGAASDLTGQSNNWEKGWGKKTTSEQHSIRGGSIAASLFEPDYFPAGTTFAAAAFDARFNYNFTAGNKQEIENAYYGWLSSKFVRSKLKVLYLAGHSRGGCLALRLARRFKNDFPEKGVIVQSYDAVCQREQNEFGVEGHGNKITNPVQSKYWSWKTDFTAQFPNTNKLAVLHYASGDAVLNLAGVHGISHNAASAQVTDYGWFRQEWVDLEHQNVDYTTSTIEGGKAHLKKWLVEFQKVEPLSLYRIRHVPTSQCLYTQPGNGQTANHWQCWDDPNMQFALEPLGHNRFRIRDYNKGQCLYGNAQNGGSVNHWECWNDPNMVFNLQQLSDSTFRIRHELTGKCLYPHGGNGGTINVWDCWADPNMVFTFDTAGNNWARDASASSDSTYGGYSLDRSHDGDRSTDLGEAFSWTNSWDTYDLPQLVEYDLGGLRQVTRVDVYTTASYPIRDFDVVAFDGVNWTTLTAVSGNTAASRSFVFPPVQASRIGIIARRGPDAQFNFARLNEVEIY